MNKYENDFRIFSAIKWGAGIRFEREYLFHPTRKWRFDFAWPGLKIAVEADGGIYGKGKPCPTCKRKPVAGHGSIQKILRDMEKLNNAQAIGWIVLRFPVDQLLKNATLQIIERAIQHRLYPNKEKS